MLITKNSVLIYLQELFDLNTFKVYQVLYPLFNYTLMHSWAAHLANVVASQGRFFWVEIDTLGNYKYVNDAFKNRFSHLASNFVGLNCVPHVHPDDHQELGNVTRLCFENPGKSFPIRIRKPINDTSFIISDWDFVAIFNDQGQPEGILCIGYEVTEFVTNIAHGQRRINDMLQVQSHEIRRYLANILGALQILDRQQLNTENEQLITLIAHCASIMDNMLQQMAAEQ